MDSLPIIILVQPPNPSEYSLVRIVSVDRSMAPEWARLHYPCRAPFLPARLPAMR